MTSPRDLIAASSPSYPGLPLKACRWLNYKGDQRRGLLGRLLGPNTLGEVLVVVEADYDAGTDRTRAGLAYVPRMRSVEP